MRHADIPPHGRAGLQPGSTPRRCGSAPTSRLLEKALSELSYEGVISRRSAARPMPKCRQRIPAAAGRCQQPVAIAGDGWTSTRWDPTVHHPRQRCGTLADDQPAQDAVDSAAPMLLSTAGPAGQ